MSNAVSQDVEPKTTTAQHPKSKALNLKSKDLKCRNIATLRPLANPKRLGATGLEHGQNSMLGVDCGTVCFQQKRPHPCTVVTKSGTWRAVYFAAVRCILQSPYLCLHIITTM